jgi:hypothetical protein
MNKRLEDAIIFVTGIVSSIICIVGYNLAADDELLNGALLLFVGAGLFCGVAYGFYGNPRPKRGFGSQFASKPRELKPIGAQPLGKEAVEERAKAADDARPGGAPVLVPSSSGQPQTAPPPSEKAVPNAEPAAVEPGSAGPQSVPAARKAVASMTAKDDEVTAANNLIAVYTELLTKIDDPSKQRTLKRWISQQEDIVKAHKSTTAKRA